MNVSKGEVAKSNDLKKSFGTEDRNTVAREVSSILSSQIIPDFFTFLLFLSLTDPQ